MYDLVFVDPAPLPPHERTWRHPSELGPTRFDVDTDGRTPMALVIAGTCAVLVVAALVVVATPRASTSQLAMSATTNPLVRTLIASAEPPAVVARGRRADLLLTSYTAYPHAISASTPDSDRLVVADEAPEPRSLVDVRTDDVTYRMKWSHVPALDAPDGTVVYDLSGDIVARVSRGELVSLVAD